MAFGVFIHRTDSIYNDRPTHQYQFPKQYLSRAQQFVGDWILYLEPSKVKDTKGYYATAKVQQIIPDPNQQDMFLAIIEKGSYLEFGDPVSFRQAMGPIETGLLNDQGRMSGRAQAAVRGISPANYHAIIDLGLGADESILPRTDEAQPITGFGEQPQAAFEPSVERKRMLQLTNRKIRDRNFRKMVIEAYNETCAITGLRLINGGGRAEVEAAHIRPVADDGSDAIANGLALSGTAHWMFDRGLIGVAEDFTLQISRQANDPDTIRSIINKSGTLIVPERPANRPRIENLNWHHENIFKH